MFYRALVEGMADGVLQRDAAGVITYASPRFHDMLGYSVEELVGTRSEFVLPPEQRSRWASGLAAAAQGPQRFEHDLICKDGRRVSVAVSRRPVFDADGAFQGTVALVSNITEERRASLLLQEVAQATAPHTGEEFFRTAVRFLARALGFKLVLVTECVDFPTTRLRTLASWRDDRLAESGEYELAGTPCEETVRSGRPYCCPRGVESRFSAEAGSGFDGYVGVPFFDAAGERVIGHMALFDDKPVDGAITEHPMLRIVCSRAEAELRRKHADELLQLVAHATAPHTGEDFFHSLVASLAQALRFKIVFVTECVNFPTTRVRTLARWASGSLAENVEYDLAGSACEETVRAGRVFHCASGVESRFSAARGLGVDSYLGVPLFDSDERQVIGHLAFVDDERIDEQVLEHPVVRIFASRAQAELRRKRADDTMLLIGRTVAPLSGEVFFRTLIEQLALTFGFRQAFISECLDFPPTRVRTVAYWDQGLRENTEFALAGLPCEITIGEGRPYFVPERLEELHPGEVGRGRVSYLGLPIFRADRKQVIGHLAFFDDRPRASNVLDSPAFRILASRAGVELLRKRAEDELRESEAKYRLLVENQTDLLVKLDRGGRYRFVSPSFCRRFGKSESELLGQPFALEVSPLDRGAFERAHAAVLVAPHRSHCEARVLAATGWQWLAWECSAIFDERGEVAEIIASGRDVTERKRAEEQARQHLQQLAHVTRVASMGEMASAIAHEINQPLTSISTYSQACVRLLRSGGASLGELTETMERVAARAHHASEIIRGLRSFVRKVDARPIPVEINFLVSEIVPLVQPEARQSGVEIATDLGAGLPAVMADNIQIEQVLLNLVRNAIDAISSCPAERREVRISTRHGPGDTVEACVQDSGPGFDEASAAQLFEPFFTTKGQGMGIGLSISRSIVEAHHGRIWASAERGRGASFHLRLPAATQDERGR
jgi:PAS domain S-box-containing protein